MADAQMHQVYSVTAQVDLDYPDDRRIRPRTVLFESFMDAAGAVERALALFGPDQVVVMVSREDVETFDHEEDPALDDWPSAEHVVTGVPTAEDL